MYDDTLPQTQDSHVVLTHTGEPITLGRVDVLNPHGGVCHEDLEVCFNKGSILYILDGYSEFKTFKELTDYLGEFKVRVGAFNL